MAPEENDKDPSHQREKVMAPLFIKKQPLNEEKKIEMEEEVESVRVAMRGVKAMWEALADSIQNDEVNVVREEVYMERVKEKEVDRFKLTPYKTRLAISKQVKTIGLDEDAVRHRCDVCIDDIQKVLMKQQKKTREAVDKWFDYLHQFDGKNLQPKPSPSNEPSLNLMYFGLVVVICAACAIFPFGSEETSVSEGEPFAYFHEKFLQVLNGVFNFYLAFHNITIDNTEATGIAFDDK